MRRGIVGAVLVVLLAACGGEDEPGATSTTWTWTPPAQTSAPPPPPLPDIAAALRELIAANPSNLAPEFAIAGAPGVTEDEVTQTATALCEGRFDPAPALALVDRHAPYPRSFLLLSPMTRLGALALRMPGCSVPPALRDAGSYTAAIANRFSLFSRLSASPTATPDPYVNAVCALTRVPKAGDVVEHFVGVATRDRVQGGLLLSMAFDAAAKHCESLVAYIQTAWRQVFG